MARAARKGGKTSAPKTRKTSSAKGRTPAAKAKPPVRHVARLKRSAAPEIELKEAREQQAATAEILKVIASSPSDVQPVFEAIAASANGLIGGFSTAVHLVTHESIQLQAYTRVSPQADRALEAAFPMYRSEMPSLAMVENGETVQVADTEVTGDAQQRRLGRARGWRSVTMTPLMNRGMFIGFIACTRRETGVLPEHHVQLLRTFADQAVIAIENARLFNETREALQRQTATADILKVIASSPSDVRPVFNAIAESARRVLGGFSSVVTRVIGEELHLAAYTSTKGGRETLEGIFPRPLTSDETHVRVVRSGQIVMHADSEGGSDAERKIARARGFRSILIVPMLRDGAPIGTIAVTKAEPHRFDDNSIGLLKTFADQAVIAIENARLFNETQEALQRQTATADVLNVISRSPTDAAPVFDVIGERAERLCNAEISVVSILDGDLIRVAGIRGISREGVELFRTNFPMPLHRQTVTARTIKSGTVVNVSDVLVDPSYDNKELAAQTGYRNCLGVPMHDKGEVIGAIFVARTQPGLFSENQVRLLQTFADQAVIAIQNVSLFEEVQARTNDLSESLQQQTATADVLKVISRSAFDLQTVLDTLVESAARLSGAPFGTIFQKRGDLYHLVAQFGYTPEMLDYGHAHPIAPGIGSNVGRTAMTAAVVQIPDVLADPNFTSLGYQRVGQFRSMLGIPIMREGSVEGVFSLAKPESGPFAPRQVQLVQTFADQAVIAIENTRLFNETKEALERQTATADILKVIASSPDDVQPVFEAIAHRAKALVDALSTTVFTLKDGVMHLRAFTPTNREADMTLQAQFPAALSSFSWAEAIQQGKIFRVIDTDREPSQLREIAQLRGFRSMLLVPLFREQRPIGIISVTREGPGPFSDHHVQLLQTFADQAVIAIENTRLFNETREALARQTATSDVLKVIASSPSNLQPVFDAIAGRSNELIGGHSTVVVRYVSGMVELAAFTRVNPEADAVLQALFPRPPASIDPQTKKVLRGEVAQISDAESELQDNSMQDAARARGWRSRLLVPLKDETGVIGWISVTRKEAGGFAEKDVELLQTFADQAVIAIKNVELFEEVQARTRDLQESLHFQTASANVLKVISRSPDALQPVLDVIVRTSRDLCNSNSSVIFFLRENKFHVVAASNEQPEYFEPVRANPISPDQLGSAIARAGREKRTIHVPNSRHDIESGLGGPLDNGPARSMLAVPLIRDAHVIGGISLGRALVDPFSSRQIEAVESFADQAVIAIANVTLFDQVQQRTSELLKSLEDLRAAQDRLVQTEKLASLGQLTAGIAHEIKNPLNFVNNFSALSAELVDEMTEVFENPALDEANRRKELDEIRELLKGNLEKVVQHGKRADSIVKNMLLHSREGSGELRAADINGLVEESLNLAYHGARAEKTGFNITLRREFDASAGSAELFPQEITRALINLISNGFYAAIKRRTENGEAEFEPTLSATTRNLGSSVEIRIRDNGTGIPAEAKEKIFNPFFTTKPAGEGTGLGLSMTHDIIVKQHGGTITVDTEPGAFTEFTVTLPRATGMQNNQRSTR